MRQSRRPRHRPGTVGTEEVIGTLFERPLPVPPGRGRLVSGASTKERINTFFDADCADYTD